MTEPNIIDGKAFAARLRARIAECVAALQQSHGLTPGLAVILVGEDPASNVYVRNKAKQTVACGMRSVEHRLPHDVLQADLLSLIAELNADGAVHGILVQLPLPGQIDEQAVMDAIDPQKDVDGFHVINAGRLAVGAAALVPCTPLGCLMMLRDRLGDLSGLAAVIVGRSNIVGKPMAALLLAANCTVTMAHSRTRDLPGVCRRADILVAAVGRSEMIRGDWIKPGAAVIDVGINRVPGTEPGKTRLVGDVAFEEAVQVAGAITPVPGGVGPMTIAVLLRNTLIAACRQAGVAEPDL
ncbi:MAG: Bifunctional protein FolD protein [Alphaproteobacteria bacterium MarineAlpha10_Bin3]|jgi:methylenetetrahydrofolate dehydrogenase (NADP+)/methenyltetrahydrofolate cyclohydrolase|nr:MAG: Bifunctional protein FolD protein [Alphaproteobacteria bacterium MarineAlpha10_Bin3]PPR71745.1 MAG: Bifunctional protein FolD protein [Alphaproteobacteria bacterium MarineAlpha4_Bin1]